MREIEAWLDVQLTPVSRIGARLGKMPRYVPGEEEQAQAAIDALLDHAAWNDDQAHVARAKLAQLHDVGQTLIAAQAATMDLVDLASLNRFLASFLFLLPSWEERVRVVDGLRIEEEAQTQLRDLHTALQRGETHDGYALHAGIDETLADLRHRQMQAQRALDQWRESALAELRAFGITAAYQAEFMIVRTAQHLLEQDRMRDRIRIVRETTEFFMCALRYDAAAVALIQQEQELARELESRERILIDTYTKHIVSCIPALDHALQWIAVLDVMLARRVFVVRHALQRAVLSPLPRFTCRDASYLPLRERLGERYTGLDLEFTSLALLSGANMGGKTIALKTVAGILACVIRGLPVPGHDVICALYDRVLWFGEDEEVHEAGLSAFGHEMEAVRRLCLPTDLRYFIVFDEFARTTAPREGRALSIAVFRGLVARGASVLAVTHFDHVAQRCGAIHYRLVGIRADALKLEQPLTNPQAVLRQLEDAFDRRFVRIDDESKDGSSQALEVAAAIGVPNDVVQDAHEELLN